MLFTVYVVVQKLSLLCYSSDSFELVKDGKTSHLLQNVLTALVIGDSMISFKSLEQFSIECRKTKTKVITTANQNKDKYHKEPMRTQSKYT